MTSELYKTSCPKARPYGAAKRSCLQEDREKYRERHNKWTSAFNRAKSRYFANVHHQLANEADGSRSWWNTAKKLAKLKTIEDPIPDLEKNSLITSGDHDEADLLAEYFAAECTKPRLMPNTLARRFHCLTPIHNLTFHPYKNKKLKIY